MKDIGVKENGEVVPIQSVCTGILYCGECGTKLTEDNSSGWETFSSASKTKPVCDKCLKNQGKTLQEQMATCVFCGVKVSSENFKQRYAKQDKPLGSVCVSCYEQIYSTKNCKMCKSSFDDIKMGGIYTKVFNHIIGMFCEKCVSDLEEIDGKIIL